MSAWPWPLLALLLCLPVGMLTSRAVRMGLCFLFYSQNPLLLCKGREEVE